MFEGFQFFSLLIFLFLIISIILTELETSDRNVPNFSERFLLCFTINILTFCLLRVIFFTFDLMRFLLMESPSGVMKGSED